MKTTKKLLVILVLFTQLMVLGKEKGYKITIELEGSTDTVFYLASYYGAQVTVSDTAYTDKQPIVFKGTERLPGGIYILVGQNKKKILEFVVDKYQSFKIQTDTSDPLKNARITNSPENDLFFEYAKLSGGQHNKIEKLKNHIALIPGSDSVHYYEKQIQIINNETVNYKIEFVGKHPDHILSLIFNTLRETEYPSSVAGNDTLKYVYYKNHYWDYVNLSDERILRIPVFSKKLDRFIDQVVPKHPDSVIRYVDFLMQKASGSKEVGKYLTWYFIERYDHPKLMGFDKVFVYVVDNYFNQDHIYEQSESIKNTINERVEKIRPLLLGQVAPNLILLDTNNQFRSLYSIDADYTMVFFWDSDCGVCKKEIAKIKEFLEDNSHNLQIYAVCVDTSLKKWKGLIKEHNLNWVNVNGTRSVTNDYHDLYDIYSTPVIYLLNRKKEIIAKRISADQLKGFLDHMVR